MARNRYYEDESSREGIDSQLLKRLLQFCKPYKKRFIICFGIMLCSVGVSLAGPLINKYLLNDVLMPATNWPLGIMLICAMASVFLLQPIINAFRDVAVSWLGQKIIFDIRRSLFAHLQKLTFKFYDDRPAGKILVRVTSYIDGLAWLLSSGIVQALCDVITLIGILVVLFCLNVKLTLVSVATVIPLMVFIVFFRRRLEKLRVNVRNKISNRNAYTFENILGLKTTQAFNREARNVKELARLNGELTEADVKMVRTSATLGPAVDFTYVVSTILLYLLGYQMVTGDTLTPGDLAAFTSYIARFWQPINSISFIYSQVVANMSNVEKIFETLDSEPDIEDAPGAVELPAVQGRVAFENVSFGYDDDRLILKNVSFTAEPGQTIALVGPTGAGKTTIVNLISRFYDPTEGRITIDGYDIKDVTVKSLRAQVMAMMQESFVFSGNIIDNIRYGRPDATDEECINAARSVYANTFIERLPNGYYTRVEEQGAGLSAGERQLLSFARIILADPKIIILDEATSAIDTRTELLIQKALAELLKGRTSFVIAHRLSTIRSADNIMCIANQGIAEQGSHEELMERKGIYYELNLAQRKAV